jgi:hypothetical protein
MCRKAAAKHQKTVTRRTNAKGFPIVLTSYKMG